MTAEIDSLLQPLSARSVVASTLLGSHPPRMPGRLLVAFGERFDIAAGTTRVALSRMIDRGELVNHDGVYELAGPLLERQDRQDRSRGHVTTAPWDGGWDQAVVVSAGRPAAQRGHLRTALGALGLAELREGVWMRPANLDAARSPSVRAQVADQVAWFRLQPLPVPEAHRLAASLFDLTAWAATANALRVALDSASARLGTDDGALVDGFMLAAATLRHFVHDPQLPAELQPADWPAEELRQAYDDYDRGYKLALRGFFRAQA